MSALQVRPGIGPCTNDAEGEIVERAILLRLDGHLGLELVKMPLLAAGDAPPFLRLAD